MEPTDESHFSIDWSSKHYQLKDQSCKRKLNLEARMHNVFIYLPLVSLSALLETNCKHSSHQ